MATINKTKSQTYNFLSENKSIEDIKKQENFKIKKIKNKRHSGQTYRIDNANNEPTNDDLNDLSENNRENLEPVTSNLTNNEKEREINNDILTKFKNYLNWPTSNTEELIQTQKKYINLINDISTNNNSKFVPIKDFLKQQENSNLNITKSEWITFLAISIFSLCLLSVPAVLTIYLPTIIVGATVGIIIAEKIGILALSTLVIGALDKVLWNLVSHKTKKIKTKTKNSIFWLLQKLPFCKSIGKNKEEKEIKNNIKKTIENLTSDKLETKLQTQYDILKQELDNKKDIKPDQLISNSTINHNSNSTIQNSIIESENNQNFDSSIRNKVNHQHQHSTISKNNWDKVKCLLTT